MSQRLAEHAEENLKAPCSELWVSGSGPGNFGITNSTSSNSTKQVHFALQQACNSTGEEEVWLHSFCKLGALPPRRNPVPIVQEVMWALGPFWTPPGFAPRNVQPVASRCTDYDILAANNSIWKCELTVSPVPKHLTIETYTVYSETAWVIN
jgi:hypothetical protein